MQSTSPISPTELLFCLRQCVYVYIFQVALAFYFAYRSIDFSKFRTESFNIFDTIMRLICALLLQIKLNGELKRGFRLMTWLKY